MISRLCFPAIAVMAFGWIALSTELSASTPDFDALLQKAKDGDSQAEEMVGVAYGTGTGVNRDYQQAYLWLKKAADNENSAAKSVLGALYAQGLGVPQDDAQAFHWYHEGALGGDPYGEVQAGQCYAQGKGVARDDAQAVIWYAKAANQGALIALNLMGTAYMNGAGVEKNPRQAFTYFLHAAFANYGPAQYNLAVCYWQGVFVSRDPLQAYKWCQLAVQNDHEKDADTLLQILMQNLTGAELSAGDNLVKQWPKERDGDLQPEAFRAIMEDSRRAKMSFTWVSRHIVVLANIEGHKDLRFLVDTGSPGSYLDDKTAANLGIPLGSDYLPASGIGSNLLLAQRVDHLDLKLRGLDFEDIALARCDLSSISALFGTHIDGILGYDLLRHFIVHLDYGFKTLELFNPQTFDESDAGSPVPMTVRGTRILVEGTISNNGKSGTSKWILDTGSDSAIILSRDWVAANPSLGPNGSVPNDSSGLGGMERESMFRCAQIQLGDIVLKDPIVELLTHGQGIWGPGDAGLIGNDIWRRFVVTIDYPDGKLFLKRNFHFHDATSYINMGLAIKGTGPDLKSYVVFDVIPESSADEAGFKVGDVLLTVDEIEVQGRSMGWLQTLLHRLGTHHVIVSRDGKPVSLYLELDEPM